MTTPALEVPQASTKTSEKATRLVTGLSLLDEGSPNPVAATNVDTSSACESSVSDGEENGAVEKTVDLAKTWKIDLEEQNDKLKCLRLRNSQWLSVFCMIDPGAPESFLGEK